MVFIAKENLWVGTAATESSIKSLALAKEQNSDVDLFESKYNEARLNELENGLGPVMFFEFSKHTILPSSTRSYEVSFEAVVPVITDNE